MALSPDMNCNCGKKAVQSFSKDFLLKDNQVGLSPGNVRHLKEGEWCTVANSMFESIVCSEQCQKAWETFYEI